MSSGQTHPDRAWRVRLRKPAGCAVVVAAVAAVPLVVAVIALSFRPWAPALDLAMTELRVRDVGGAHTPLVGLPGRIGVFPDSQGSHPGPASFYLLAPWYRLAGASAWGLELGSVVVNSAAIALLVMIGYRLAGRSGALAMGSVAAVAVRGYGLNVLTHPWNPYFPVVLWLVVLVATWAVVAGHHRAAIGVSVGASIAAQTHVPYLLNGVSLVALTAVTLAWSWRRTEDSADRRAVRNSALVALAAGTVVWIPPLIDQLRNRPGNTRLLYRHFAADPPEPAIGAGEALQVFLRHLDVPSVALDLITHRAAFVHRSGLPDGDGWLGAIVLLVWVGAAVLAARRRHRLLNSLNVVLAVALAAGALSISRIFGKVWYYLTLWAWGTTSLVVVSIVWTVGLLLGERRRAASAVRFDIAIGAIGLAATAASVGAAFVLDVPEAQLSDSLREVVPATTAAVDAGDGPAVGSDGRYIVFWQDAAFNGAQGYGLVNELERRGYQVGVHPTWRVPVTQHRVFTEGEYDAEIHLVSGVFIDEWETRAGFEKVLEYDRRTDAERRRFDELRTRVVERLAEVDRDDLVTKVDENLFGASLDPDLPRDIVDDMSEMLLLAVPIAVFLAPPGSSA